PHRMVLGRVGAPVLRDCPVCGGARRGALMDMRHGEEYFTILRKFRFNLRTKKAYRESLFRLWQEYETEASTGCGRSPDRETVAGRCVDQPCGTGREGGRVERVLLAADQVAGAGGGAAQGRAVGRSGERRAAGQCAV